MDESVICIGEVQEDNSVRREVLGELGRQVSHEPSGDSVIYMRRYCLRSNQRKLCKSKENLKPVATVDLTKEPEPVKRVKPSNVLPERRVNNQPECPLCFESLFNVAVRVTDCGHLFCRSCMDKVIAMNGRKCPKCRKYINENLVRPVYL